MYVTKYPNSLISMTEGLQVNAGPFSRSSRLGPKKHMRGEDAGVQSAGHGSSSFHVVCME